MSRGPSPVVAFATLALTRSSLRFLGFRRTLRLVRRAAGTPTRPPRGTVERAAHSVAVAAAFFPGRAVCLEQSLALYVLLRRRGHPAELKIGVQPYPFEAHAWVEIEGRPLFENEDALSKYTPFPGAFA